MQEWINLVKEWVIAQGYLTAGYVDRGNAPAYDFVMGDFVKDGAWHDLDLSSIVPAGAKGVALHLIMAASTISEAVWFRKKGYPDLYNTSVTYVQVAGLINSADKVVALDENRIIEYMITPDTWYTLSVHVKCWWF